MKGFEILPNGAVIHCIDLKRMVVLAEMEGSYMPWVTWKYYGGDLRSTSHGHYFKDESEAKSDFYIRSMDL